MPHEVSKNLPFCHPWHLFWQATAVPWHPGPVCQFRTWSSYSSTPQAQTFFDMSCLERSSLSQRDTEFRDPVIKDWNLLSLILFEMLESEFVSHFHIHFEEVSSLRAACWRRVAVERAASSETVRASPSWHDMHPPPRPGQFRVVQKAKTREKRTCHGIHWSCPTRFHETGQILAHRSLGPQKGSVFWFREMGPLNLRKFCLVKY